VSNACQHDLITKASQEMQGDIRIPMLHNLLQGSGFKPDGIKYFFWRKKILIVHRYLRAIYIQQRKY